MTDTVLARDERVVRRYPCTAVDRVALIAGTVVPLPGGAESRGVLTLTDRRVIFELEADGGACDRQEARLSDVSSISSMMSKFGRDLRLPIALIVIGFVLMFAPYVALSESGAFDHVGDYGEGYDDGVEYGYFLTYLRAVQDGTAPGPIPDGYSFVGADGPISEAYAEGYNDGYPVGVARAQGDLASGEAFSIPADLLGHGDPSLVCALLAVLGALVFVSGSVLYYVSNTTKDWVSIRMGSGGRGIAVKTFGAGWDSSGRRALTAEDQYWSMTRELGAAILDLRGYREHRVRTVEDDVVIEGQDDDDDDGRQGSGDRGGLEPAPDFEDLEDVLVIGDDGEGRVVIPWDRRPGPSRCCSRSPWPCSS